MELVVVDSDDDAVAVAVVVGVGIVAVDNLVDLADFVGDYNCPDYCCNTEVDCCRRGSAIHE